MMKLRLEKYRSSRTPWEIFRNVYVSSKTCFFLDSPRYAPPDQRYSYIGMDPALEIRLEKKLFIEGEVQKSYPASRLFPVLRKILNGHRTRLAGPHPFFTGGLVGYWGYDLAGLCDKVPFRPKKGPGMPRLGLGLFRNVIIYDHKKKIYYLAVHARDPVRAKNAIQKLAAFFTDLSEYQQNPSPHPSPLRGEDFDGELSRTGRVRGNIRIGAKASAVKPSGKFRVEKFRTEISRKRFEGMVAKAKDSIAAGDIYQANLSQRFSFNFSGPALDLYGKLRAINPSPFSCFLKIKGLEVISASPERLIRKKGRECETRPIAGTYPAYGPRRRLRLWRQKLLRNEKERAEHLMLVDLERNDLGRVCDYRSVRVEEFMELEKYSHVVHLVSKVTGRLKKGKDALDLLKAVFPGGTITGCPKIQCMKVIDELEPVKRGLYTGSIGYLGFNGDMDLNIVIRTLILKGQRGHLQVGAGIVHDSVPGKEYKETLHKARALVMALKEAGKNKK